MKNHTEYEALCLAHLSMLKRYLFHKISNHADAEDVLQDILLATYNGFDRLREKGMFKSWLFSIASNKCIDYYKARAKKLEIPLDEISGSLVDSHGMETAMLVNDTLNMLRGKDKQILYLFYIRGYNQKDIATKLGVPLGTVKSRINTAKEHFKATYAHEGTDETYKKGENIMKKNQKFPAVMPAFTIEKMNEKPFDVRFEEIPGWLIIPRVGEKTSFAFYDDPDQRFTGMHIMHCIREAEVHGIPCVQVETEYTDENGNVSDKHSKFMRLSDTHASYVAEMRIKDNVLHFGSFYDDSWLENYQIGNNNIGRAIDQKAKGIATLNADSTMTITKEECADIIGRYKVEMNGRSYDTVAIVEVCEGIMTILYVDQNGRTVIFRRYNRFDWKQDRYKALWTDKLPNSEVLNVNGDKYIHWYDCIGDYVL